MHEQQPNSHDNLEQHLRDGCCNHPFELQAISADWNIINEEAIRRAGMPGRSPQRVWGDDILDVFRSTQRQEGYVRPLIEGALNVINLIVNESSHDPYELIIVLDKSGRLGWHFVRKLWGKLSKDERFAGLLPSLPPVVFANIGTEKTRLETGVIKRLVASDGSKDTPIASHKKRLIIDDFIYTGGTALLAAELLKNGAETHVVSLIHEAETPWIDQESAKGVTDPDFDKVTRYLIMNGTTAVAQFEQLRLMYTKNHRHFIALLQASKHAYQIEKLTTLLKIPPIGSYVINQYIFPNSTNGNFGANVAGWLQQPMRQLLQTFSSEEILEFVKYSGGFLAKPARNHVIGARGKLVSAPEQHRRARVYFAELAKLAVEHIGLRSAIN